MRDAIDNLIENGLARYMAKNNREKVEQSCVYVRYDQTKGIFYEGELIKKEVQEATEQIQFLVDL